MKIFELFLPHLTIVGAFIVLVSGSVVYILWLEFKGLELLKMKI